MFVGSLVRRWLKCVQAHFLLLGLLVVPALAQFETSSPYPRVELFGGGSCFLPNGSYLKSDPTKAPTMMGWGTSIYTPFSRNAGSVLDISGNYGSGGSVHTILFGAEYKPRRWRMLQPFGEGMLGWSRRSPKNLPDNAGTAFLAGGGLDIPVDHRFAIRLFRADYVFSFNNPEYAGEKQQSFWNSIRIQSGIIMNFGAPAEEGAVSLECAATPSQVKVGEPVTAKLTPIGFVPRRKLSYEWQVNDGKLASTASNTVIETTSFSPGDYTVKGTASDNAKGKHHQSASCTATFAVLEAPKPEAPATTASESQPAADAPAKADGQPATDAAAITPEAQPSQPSGATETASAPSTDKAASTSETQPSSAADTHGAEAPSASKEVAPQQTAPAQAPDSNGVQPSTPGAQTPQQAPAAAAENPKQSQNSATETASSAPLPTKHEDATAVQPGTANTDNAVTAAAPVAPARASAKSMAKKQVSKAKKLAVATPNASTQPKVAPVPAEASTQVVIAAAPAVVVSGEPATITVRKPSPDKTAPAPSCTTSAGTLRPDNGNLTLDTAGVPTGKVTVTCTESDGHPLGATTVQVTTQAKPGPQARKLNSIRFNSVKRPARVDNVAKQILRDAAHALQQSEPGSKLILVGNAREHELEANNNIALQRATNARAFLMDKQNGGGVDASSINIFVGKSNARRVDVYLAAPGTNFNPSDLTRHAVESKSAKKISQTHARRVVEK